MCFTARPAGLLTIISLHTPHLPFGQSFFQGIAFSHIKAISCGKVANQYEDHAVPGCVGKCRRKCGYVGGSVVVPPSGRECRIQCRWREHCQDGCWIGSRRHAQRAQVGALKTIKKKL